MDVNQRTRRLGTVAATATGFVTAAATVLAATGCGRDTQDSGSSATASAPVASPTGVSPTGSPGTPGAAGSPTASLTSSAGPTAFSARIERVERAEVRHSWRPGCPVPLSGLRTIRMTYWGFDDRAHTGELVVNAKAAQDLVKVFKRLYDRKYPIRRMESVDVYKGSDFDSIEANNTSAFNCRSATGSGSWSQHAYGLAVDINPCENPYVSSDGHVAHPRCVKYRNRSRKDPAVIHRNDPVVRAFSSIGWGWGGLWSSVKDYQHFSSNGR